MSSTELVSRRACEPGTNWATSGSRIQEHLPHVDEHLRRPNEVDVDDGLAFPGLIAHRGTQLAWNKRGSGGQAWSRDIAERVEVGTLNGVEEWGPSDHCRIAFALAH